MRKLISLVLTLLILTSLLPNSVSAAQTVFSDTDGGEYYYPAAVELSSRGILTGYPDGSFGAERTITRAEMATIICRMTGRDLVAEISPGNSYYTDVADSHWAMAYINLATDDKIINGDGNGLFRPEDSVNYQEAVKLVVCAAGYGRNIEINENDWSLGYINMANEKGMTKNLVGKKGEALNRGDVAVLVYNAVKLMDEDSEKQMQNAQELARLSGDEEPDVYYERTGQLGGYVGTFYDKKITDGDDAKESLALLKDYIGIDDVDAELEFVESYESGEFVIYVMNQIYKGILVYGHEVRVKTDKKGDSVSMTSGFLNIEDINVKPSINKEYVVDIIEAEYEGCIIDKDSLELVIYADANEEPYLAYMIELETSTENSRFRAVIDAHTGEIKDFYAVGSTEANYDDQYVGEDVNGIPRAFGVEKDNLGYNLIDNERKIYTRASIYDPKMQGVTYGFSTSEYNPKYDNDLNKDGYKDLQLALTAHSNLSAVFDYYRDVHKHTYISGDPKSPYTVEVVVPSYKAGGTVYKNAYADKGELKSRKLGTLGFGAANGTFSENGQSYNYNFATSIDFVAHEFNHLVFSFKANSVSSKYKGHNGAINEAYSDIMAQYAEASLSGKGYCDWNMGAEISGEEYRDLKNPTSMGFPSKVDGDHYLEPSSSEDNGGVHRNSTIIGHAAYLMSESIDNHKKLEKLWYNSMDNYAGLSDFTHVRKAVLEAADELHFSNKEKDAIKKAFKDVGIEDPTPDVTFYTIKYGSNMEPIPGATIEFKKAGLGLKSFDKKTDSDGKVIVKLSELPFPLKIIAKKKGYEDKVISDYGIGKSKLQEHRIVIPLLKEGETEEEKNNARFDLNEDTNTVTIYKNETPIYSVSNVIAHTKREVHDISGGVVLEEESFVCEFPVVVTAIKGGEWFEIMDWTPSMQTGQSMDVGFILPDSCPNAEAYEYDDTGEFSWNIKPNTTHTIEQPGYYHISTGCFVDPQGTNNPEDFEYINLGAVLKIEGQRTANPTKYRVLENSWMYDEALYNNLFKYGTEVSVEAQDGYYILGEDCDLYKIYPDNGASQDAAISFEPLAENAEFDASFSVLRDTDWRNIPQPATISYCVQKIESGEIGFLNMHKGNVKISANGIKVVGVKTEGSVVPAGREMMFEVDKETTIVVRDSSSYSYEVYDEYYEYADGSSYKKLAFSGNDLSAPITVRAGQKLKIKAGNSDVKLIHQKYAIHLSAYMSR